MIVWLFSSWLFVLPCLGLAQTATVGLHQNYLTPPNIDAGITPLNADNAFGEHIDLSNGGVDFDLTDIDISGNNDLPVKLARKLVVKDRLHDQGRIGGFGDWDLDIPRMHGIFADGYGWEVQGANPNARCSDPGLPPDTGYFTASQYWNGYWLYTPQAGDQALLGYPNSTIPALSDGNDYPWITKSFWRVRCEPSTKNSYPGEGFIAVSPEGVAYYFDWGVQVPATVISQGYDYLGSHSVGIARNKIYFLVTQIEDRFGNWVKYTYSSDNQLQSITSNDGRYINLTWNNGQIVKAVSNKGTWNYGYNGSSLQTVTLPDNSEWNYSFTGSLAVMPPNPPEPAPVYQQTPTCSPQSLSSGGFTYTVTHPAGATATYNFVVQRHYRGNVPKYCNSTLVPYGQSGEVSYEWLTIPNFFDTLTLTSKQVTGPGLPSPMTWAYTYDGSLMFFSAGCQVPTSIPYCPESTETEVSGPGSIYHRYYFGAWFGVNEGQLLEEDTGTDASHILRTQTYTYSDATGQPFPDTVGDDIYPYSDQVSTVQLRPQSQSSITQDGVTFATTVNHFDVFARATSDTETGTASRTITTAYYDDLTHWVLGQISSTSTIGTAVPCTTSIASSDTDLTSCTLYDLNTALPLQTYQFGRLVSKKTWQVNGTDQSGTLTSVTDGDGNITSFPQGWTLGLPNQVQFADGTTVEASINGAGEIASLEDETGFTTHYDYDLMGRLSEVDYPSSDDVPWNSTFISFSPNGAGQYGMPAGAWVRSVTTGHEVTNTYFDALWRPLVTEHFDSGIGNTTMSQVIDGYDAVGRKVFQSYPTRGATSYTQSLPGIHTSYDALDRVTEVDQDSDGSVSLPTTIQYLTGFRTVVTLPNGSKTATTTSYRAYGEPTTQWPVSITAPEGQLTKIDRDVFGKPLAITRTGTASGSPSLTQTFVYNSYQQLCGHFDLESGTTAYGYDDAGNLEWSASGLDASAGCYSENDTPVANRLVTRTYDSRNRLETITYKDGFSTTSFGYYPDGKLKSQSVANGGFPVSTIYTYDKRRLLTSETESLPGTSAFAIGYGYDANGHIASVVYPDKRTITYLPNALGQPTQAGSYATGVQYYPNGAIASFNYGNGAVHTMTEDERGLVGRSIDSRNGTTAMDFTYNYDDDGNVKAITDGTGGNVGNVDMTYDWLDRLTEADSPMFGGTVTNPGTALYGYDVFDNLGSAQLGNQGFDYIYNAKNQLAALTDPSTGNDEVQYQYDVQGNLASKNEQVYQFDMANRLESVSGLANYRYDAAGRRAQKMELITGKTLDSDYSQAGSLMYQWDPATLNATDYIYLGDTLVSRVVGNNSQVIGNIDGVPTADNPVVGGWACSTGIVGSISVELYIGGPWNGDDGNQGTLITTTTADLPSESKVGASCGTNGTNYRFSIPISTAVESQYPNEPIWVYGISPVGNYTNALTNSGTYTVPANPSAPEPPASISVPSTNIGGSYTVSWSASSGATSYVLQQESNIMPNWEQVYSGASTSTSVSVGSLEFRYQVQACNANACSSFSTPSSWVTVVPTAPASISVPSSSYSASIPVSWAASSIATNYVLEERENGGSWGVAWSGGGTSTTVTVSSTGSYQFQIAACGETGCSAFTPSSNVAVTLPPTSAPTLSGPLSSATGSYTLSWNTVSGATRYQLNQNLSGTVTTPYNANGTSWSSSALGNGTYNYQVYACNVAGCGPGSNGLAVSVLHVPSAPGSVTAPLLAKVNVSFNVSWSAVSTATSYNLRQTESGSRSQVTTIYSGSNTIRGVTLTGIAGDSFQYAVQACNSAGCSAWTNATHVTTLSNGGPLVVTPVSGGSS